MSSMVSRWPVVVHVPLVAGDADGEGRLTRAGAERVFAVARDAYLERCETVDAATVEVRSTSVRPGDGTVAETVTVSAGVVELYPDSFTMTGRIRPAAGPALAADVTCSLSAGEVTKAMRDEFIALAHAAAHAH